MLAFFTNLVSLLINSVIVPYFDLSSNLKRKTMKNGQREPIFDWKLAPIVHKQVRSLEMIMYSAHFAVAIY